MSKASKVRRNDLCPCRSVKKYKYCCGSKARDSEPEETSDNRAIRCSIKWLESRYNKAFVDAIEDTMFGNLSPDEIQAVMDLDNETLSAIGINVTKLVLAEG